MNDKVEPQSFTCLPGDAEPRRLIEPMTVSSLPAGIEAKHTSLRMKILFAIFGCGPSMFVVIGIYLQVPWLEISQPEALKMSAWLGVSQSFAVILLFLFLWIDVKYRFDQRKLAVYDSAFGLSILIFVSCTWSFTVSGVSLAIFVSMACGTFVGLIGFTVVIPWISHFNPRLISAYWSGLGFLTILMVAIEVAQEPGSSRNFTPTVFFLSYSWVIILAILAGIWIKRQDIGTIGNNPDAVQLLSAWRTSLWAQVFPSYSGKALPYLGIKIWTAALTHWILVVMLPFAAAHTESGPDDDCEEGSGADVLQWCYGMGHVATLFGTLLSNCAARKFYLRPLLGLQTIAVFIVIIAATGMFDFTSKGMKEIIVFLATLVNFLFGWIGPCVFREAAMRNPAHAEGINRFISLWVSIAAAIMQNGLFVIVQGFFRC